MRAPSGELQVITKAYGLALELTDRVRKFPRDLRFVLGDRLLATAYDLLDALVAARYTAERAALGLLTQTPGRARLCGIRSAG